MRRLICLIVAVLLAGCLRHVDGMAAVGARDVGPEYFFAGAVPTYGQVVSADDAAALAYLRAVRRIDPCGLLTRDALAKVGEIGSVGTLFTFDECDVDIKAAGQARRFVSVEVVLTRSTGSPVAFRAGGLPIYEVYSGSCDYLVPLELSRLPGAPPLRRPDQPFVRIGLIADQDCEFAQRLVRAVAPGLAALRLPVRDAVAAYPAALAERDPCQVLAVAPATVDHWDVDRTRPYTCAFRLRDKEIGDAVALRVTLQPQLVGMVAETRERRDRDGVELFVDEAYCSVVAFVGAPMRRKLVGGDFVGTGEQVIRPAVVVDSGGRDCDTVADVAVAAAWLYS